jgi:hypothetical protein
LQLSQAIGTRTALRVALGRFAQFQRPHEVDIAHGETGFAPADRAVEGGGELERVAWRGVRLRAGGYVRTYARLRPRYVQLAPYTLALLDADPDNQMRLSPAERVVRRAEVSAEVDTLPHWLQTVRVAYAWSRASDEIDGSVFPTPYDQRHAVHFETVVNGWGWQLGAAWRRRSGWPATLQRLAVVPNGDGTLVLRREVGAYHALRLAPYHRLDLRAQRSWSLGRRSRVTTFVDLLNAYDQRNPGAVADVFLDYAGAPTPRLRLEVPLMRRVGNAGVRWEF